YWVAHLPKEESGLNKDFTFVAAVDCTGHGVPGAFMSIIGTNLLNEIVNNKKMTDPAQILEALHEGVKVAVVETRGMNTAGMDVCLCRIEKAEGDNVIIQYAGAKRDLWFIAKGETLVQKLNGDRR